MDYTKIESGLQLFSRLKQRASVEKLNPLIFSMGPFSNEIIEVFGSPVTGQTLFIADLLARCILPQKYNGTNCGAVLINTSHHLDMLKLISIMEVLIKQSGDKLDFALEDIIKNSLSNLIILNCYDGEQLHLTFLSLEKILCENLNIGLVVLDSLSAYYWEYRVSRGIISFQYYHSKVLDNLKDSIKNSNVVTIFTRSEIEPVSEREAYMLKTTYKIALKEVDEKFAAVITNTSENIFRTVFYKIDTAIKFLVD